LYGIARPIRVTATSSTGIAHSKDMNTEDSITLTVQWENLVSSSSTTTPTKRSVGCAVYTSSWVAPKSDVHSQQRFFYMGSSGEVLIDQAHRGCTVSTDATGFASVNPLFMKYTPTNGYFSGQP
jgi:D-galacturonate reductase